jgi:hypothetical protein
MKRTAARKARDKADDLFAELIRSRGYCQRCGKTERLQCAHIITRIHAPTRCLPQNAWCLCAGCHMRLHQYADEHMALVEQTIGMDAYWEMKHLAETALHVWRESDWLDVIASLKAAA